MLYLHAFPDDERLAHAAATFVAARLAQAVAQRGTASLALAGGNTPRRLYTLLGQPPYREAIPWGRVHLFWGDERAVPPDHEGSNFRLVQETLLAAVPLRPEQVHRIPGERGAEAAAAAYEADLRTHFGGLPRFDLVLLGLGADGHTASLFPHSPALEEATHWVVAAPGPPPYSQRVTLTYPTLNAARCTAFLVSGTAKREAVARLLHGLTSPETTPAAGVRSATRHLFLTFDTLP